MGDQGNSLKRVANGPAANGGFVLDRQCGQGLCPGSHSKALFDFGSERAGQKADRENGPCRSAPLGSRLRLPLRDGPSFGRRKQATGGVRWRRSKSFGKRSRSLKIMRAL